MSTIGQCVAFLVSVGLACAKNQSPSEERLGFFDAELLQVFNQREEANLVVSPVSVKFLLGMLMEGAAEGTEREIRTALRLPDEKEAARKEFDTWASLVQVNSPHTLKIANRMFLSGRHPVRPEFGKTLRRYYSGGVTDVGFEDARAAAKTINDWVGNQTSQLIRSIVEERQIAADNKLVLASAVYFRGFWASPFAGERTAVRCFYPKENKCRDALMMMDTGHFDYGYVSRLDAQAVVLPYKGGRFSMVVLLPKKRDGAEQLARDLVHVGLKSVLAETERQEVFVQIPRFEISHNEDLVDVLKQVRISRAFGERANLSNIFPAGRDSAFVSHVFHSAKITVDEEGTEAAAATGALFVPLMGGTTTSFIANHPFLFFIVESSKTLILFAGKVFSPQLPDKIRADSQARKPPFQENHSAARPDVSSAARAKESKTNQRGQVGGPKFRSIKSNFSVPRPPNYLPVGPPFPHSFYEQFGPGAAKLKRPQELPKPRKALPEGDWRHHVLFFT